MKISKYKEIENALRGQILAGELTDMLPPERELSRQFGVSYLTVRRAVGALVNCGLLSREHGRGVFVNTPGRSKNRTYGIGFIVPERVLSDDGMLSPYYLEVFAGAAREAQLHGWHLILDCKPENMLPLDGENGMGKKVDAILAVCPDDHEQFKTVSQFIPTVMVGHDYPNENYPAVFVDDFSGAYCAVDYLLKNGHRRIAHIYGPKNNLSFYSRLCGYRKALEDTGCSLSPELEISIDEFRQLTSDAFSGEGGISAVFCHNDACAYQLINMLAEMGLKVPGDVSVIGFDDLPYSCVWSPPLTTIRVPKHEVGKQGVRKALSFLNNELSPREFKEEIKLELIVRKSTKRVLT